VCCNTACADATSGGLCKTCRGTKTSQAGTCSNVDSGGSDPKSRCVQTNASGGICTSDGTCDGSGACRAWSSSTGCRQASCTGSTLTYSANCDGKGGCPAATTSSCGSYECNPTSPTCLNTCKSNSDCTGGITCNTVTNKCGDKSTNGDTCNVGTDCTSGYCVDGYCCNKACTDGCQSCKATPGTCLPIGQGLPPRVTSPTTCPAADLGACGNTGNCDNDHCEVLATCSPNITSCPTDPSLKGYQYKTAIDSGSCSQTNTCNPVAVEACSTVANSGPGYLCVSGKCATACGPTDANCDTASGYYCFNSTCRKPAAGESCANPARQCPTGLSCVDGVCCHNAGLTGTPPNCPVCQSCNLTANPGTCTNVTPQNTPDDGCPGTCSADRITPSGLCDGNGHCQGTMPSCSSGFACSNGICETSCTKNSDCAPGYECSGTTCKISNGQSCTGAGTTCASGHCVQKVSEAGTSSICCASSCPSVASTCGDNNRCLGDGSGCANSAGETCNDGDSCTRNDVCDSTGHCNGASYTCSDGLLCTADNCNGDGTCSFPVTSGNCLIGGTCYGSGTPNPSNPCQVCTPTSSQTGWTAKGNGTGCSDGNACTTGDTCQGGTCHSGSAVVCAALDQCHQIGTCDTNTGVCSNPNAPNGTGCSDGDACTVGDTCQGGTCHSGSAVVCAALDQCHQIGTCDTNTGVCSNPNAPNGTGCSDGDACTVGDICSGGACVPGTAALDCDDSNVCTTDACNPIGGCTHTITTGAGCDTGQAPSCSGGVTLLLSAGTCDVNGSCVRNSTDCTPYLCANNACTTICALDADCASGHSCNTGTGQCL
jgi:hypothetical protein